MQCNRSSIELWILKTTLAATGITTTSTRSWILTYEWISQIISKQDKLVEIAHPDVALLLIAHLYVAQYEIHSFVAWWIITKTWWSKH